MRYLTIVAVGMVLAGAAQATPDPTVHYSLKPQMTDGALTAVEFEMRFHAAQAQTEVDLPDSWAHGKAYYKALKDIEITGAIAVSAPANQPAQRMITARPGAEITVRYHVDADLKAGEEAPYATDMNYPVIGPNRFYILGESVWATVAGNGDRPATFSADMPKGWAFASNLQNLASLHGTDDDVVKSILMGGSDVHIDTIQMPNTRLRIATAGRFDFTLAEFSDRVQRIGATEQAFWGDGQPNFLVTLAPITPKPGHMSSHGEGRSGAYALMTVPDMPFVEVTFTIAHEYFHSWNPTELGQMESGPNEALGYWFSEGFTDYYGRKLALKAGVVSLEQFVAEWNAALGSYAGSPHRLASNIELRDHQWADEAWHKAAYDRGAILAVYLNAEWRVKGVTLDRFMHVLRDRVAADPAFGKLPVAQRVETVAASLGVPMHDELTRFVDGGEVLVLPADAFGGCLSVMTEQVTDVDFGFDYDKTVAARAFAGVEPDGAAYTAGIRDGMKWLSINGDSSRNDLPVTIKVRDGDGHEHIISYLPEGKTSHDRQRVAIPDGLTPEAQAACIAAVTG